jgi:ankyrin repeat protein
VTRHSRIWGIGVVFACVLASTWANAQGNDLITASSNGDLPRVKALLAAGSDVNSKANDGGTALVAASQRGYLEIVQALLAAKADVNVNTDKSATALIGASQHGYLEIVRALLAAKADVNAKWGVGVTALMAASMNGHVEVVQALLAAKADVNAKTNNGGTALIAASMNGHLDAVRALLAANADVNAKGNDGGTALILASQHGHLEVVQALLAAKAEVNAKLNNGATALSLASQQGHAEVAQALLAAKADVNANPSLAQTQTPARASALPSDAELDGLVAARNWGALSTALSQAADGEPLMRKLNWLHSRIPAGGPSLLGFTAVRDMWKVGVNVKQPDPNKDFRITAGMLTLYTYEIILIDGAECEDQTAPAHRVEQLLQFGGPALAYLKTQSNEFVAHTVDIAIALEKKTAPLRKQDDLLCRDGMEQMKAGMERGKQHEVTTQSGHIGKTFAAPPDWTPAFLSPEKYEPIQDKARADMKSRLSQLVQ